MIKFKKWLLMPVAARHVLMPGRSYTGGAGALTEPELLSRSNCVRHVAMLAETIGERHLGCPEKLTAAANYIAGCFNDYGYDVTRHQFTTPKGMETNLVAVKPGRRNASLIVGAHYDTVPGSPGANDNATGIAALLELARVFSTLETLDLTVKFVSFANEENPQQPKEWMGSHEYAKHCRQNNDQIAGMWSLETMGCYSDKPGSQHYPHPFDLFYPTTGDFIAFVGNESSRTWLRESIKAFRIGAKIPSEGVAAPESFKDIGRSDHSSFWQFGYPALMVTDTANFRYGHYHTNSDTPDKVNFDSLVRVISGLCFALQKLATK